MRESGSKTLRTHGAMAFEQSLTEPWCHGIVVGVFPVEHGVMIHDGYIMLHQFFSDFFTHFFAAMMLFCCLEAWKANLARVRSYRAAIVGGSQNVCILSMDPDGFWPEAAVTSAGWPMVLWQLVCGEKSAVHVVLVNSL